MQQKFVRKGNITYVTNIKMQNKINSRGLSFDVELQNSCFKVFQ